MLTYRLDTGSIHASTVLYKSTLHLYISRLLDDRLCTELLETVLFANTRFHDTVSRGRLLNRFGKDFEGRSSSVTARRIYLTSTQVSTAAFQLTLVVAQSGAFSVTATFLTISVVGGPQFLLFIIFIGSLYWNGE
jgi:hypothetical protein